MADDFLSNLASGLKVWSGVSDAYHNRDVNNRIDQIMKASNGGKSDLNSLDPSLTSDGVGMEAMGKISAQLSKTGQAQDQIFQNALVNANNQWKLANQYMSDFQKASEDPKRQGDAANLLISMGNNMGVPYRYSMGENGKIKVSHITPDGEQDMGEMSLVDAYRMAKDYLSSQDSFVKNSVMHNMTMADQNAQIQAAGASKWMHGVDPRTGRQVMAFPQYNLNNGSVEYFVQGVGKVSPEQLSQMGIQWGTAAATARMGLRAGGLVGGGRGLGVGRGGGRKSTPAQFMKAMNDETVSAMSFLGYSFDKKTGRWGTYNDMNEFEPVDPQDADFQAALQQSKETALAALEEAGFDTSRASHPSNNKGNATPSANGNTSNAAAILQKIYAQYEAEKKGAK